MHADHGDRLWGLFGLGGFMGIHGVFVCLGLNSDHGDDRGRGDTG